MPGLFVSAPNPLSLNPLSLNPQTHLLQSFTAVALELWQEADHIGPQNNETEQQHQRKTDRENIELRCRASDDTERAVDD